MANKYESKANRVSMNGKHLWLSCIPVSMQLMALYSVLAVPSTAHAMTSFFVPAGDVARLIAVINAANDETSNRGPDTILLQGGTFTLRAPLPSITSRVVISGESPNVVIERAAGV